MATPRITHCQRERAVLTDIESCFPNFAGNSEPWIDVPNGQDPPDFISREAHATIGLELVEWLDGDQMGPAKSRESQREQLHRVLARDWENEYQPTNFRGAFPSTLAGERIARSDEMPLRLEFFACAAEVDRTWAADADYWGNSYYQTEFARYPLLGKYFNAIRYIGGQPHGSCWIGAQGDGGAFDPYQTLTTLKQALDSKLRSYSTPEKQTHLKSHCLTELDLLAHGGSNIEIYNTPTGPLTLDEIAKRGADYYATHPQRRAFDRVWFFHSVDAADQLNQSLGFVPGAGRVRWLAQLWPDFKVYPGSVAR